MKAFDGRVAVITGGASGIGLGMARRFISEGMKVVLADVDPDLEAVASELRETGAHVIGIPTDVSDWVQVEALRDHTVDAFGTAHIVCNNAGTASKMAIDDISVERWEFELGVNLFGPIHGIKAFLPMLRAQDEGHIVNTASMSGFLPFPLTAPYNVSKAGLVALTETLANELAQEGSKVHTSVLCPGVVRTNLGRTVMRNLPAHLRSQGTPVPDGAQQGLESGPVAQGSRSDSLAASLSPAQVADIVLDAIKTEKLHIFTHPAFLRLTQRRFDAIVSGVNPPVLRSS